MSSGYSFWIDPAFGGYGSPKITDSSSTNAFDGISLNIASSDSAGPSTTVILDEFRLGYTWVDVVLPPAISVLVPDVAIAPAIKLHWQSQTGKIYQVQYSYDWATWFTLGSAISGYNQMKEVFDSTDPSAKKYYRVQVP